MSATIISDPMVVSSSPSPSPAVTTPPEIITTTHATETTISSSKLVAQTEFEFAKCDCCGLTEECTPEYIERVRERYQGKWICGLCGEAVKDEIGRTKRLISTEEAMARHMNFCQQFVSSSLSSSSSPPPDPTAHLISAMRNILRRSLDSPKGLRLRSTTTSPTRNVGEIQSAALTRSESCFPTIS